ncbi:MAG: DUF4159 domain-containing protein [Phycisphaerae bacterium]|nr:DUF4159 domain-containing protein [Phycisphaerae bacterium]
MKRIWVWMAGILMLSLPATDALAGVREPSDQDIDRAIEAAKNYLWSKQNKDGGWQHTHYEYNYRLPSYFPSAICAYALLEAGETVKGNPKMAKGVEFLANLKLGNLQVVALRSMALGRVIAEDKKSPYRKQLAEDLKWLLGSGKNPFRGSWGAGGPDPQGDNMCNQFGLMAMWESRQAGLKLKKQIFGIAEKVWVKRQCKDGGWPFAQAGGISVPPDVRMTAAGLSSLYICWDVTTLASGQYRYHKNMDAGWEFLDKNFTPDFIHNNYSAYCIQQLGMLSGRKFIGKHDWYAIAAAKLAEPQPAGSEYHTGQWGPIVRAAFELLLLAKGRTPLTFNKLNYGEKTRWNYHPRDIARFTDYMKYAYERPMRWQIVTPADDVKTLQDAPLLFMGGDQSLPLDDKTWRLLREYTLRGGTLLFVPSKNSKPFLESAKKGLESLYDAQRNEAGNYYKLEQLPGDHPLYTVQQKIANGEKIIPLWAVGDGTRPLAILCEKDIASAWQRKAHTVMKRDFDMGVNLFMFTTGKNSLSSRMRPVFTDKGEGEVRHTARVAWLKHNGNWNTQPFALESLSEKLVAENRLQLKITKGCPITPEALKDQHLLWMTGTDAFTITDDERNALKQYLRDGGTLFVNAVGGQRGFDGAARKLLLELRDDLRLTDGEADISNPLYTGVIGDFRGPKIKSMKDLARTIALRTADARSTSPFYVYHRGKDILMIHVGRGIHDTLDGHTAFGAKSYMPDSARDLAANVVLYAYAGKPKTDTKSKPKDQKPKTPAKK